MTVELSKTYDRATAVYLVRCHGTHEDGSPCLALVPVQLQEKSVCRACGLMFPPYAEYCLLSRTKIAASLAPEDFLPSGSDQ